MNSPPVSPCFELDGASQVTGGILCGRAYGNVYNHADAEMTFDLESQMGKVQVYTTCADLTLTKPDMVLKHKVTPKLKPILKALAWGHSPVHSTLYIIFWIIFSIICRWQSPCFCIWRWYVDNQGMVWACSRKWWWCELESVGPMKIVKTCCDFCL